MTRNELFSMLLLTLMMGVSGARELRAGRISMGVVLLGIPVIGWIAMLFGRAA